MKDLIAALQIFLKYGDDHNPTHCEHDVLLVGVHPEVVSGEDKEALKQLGFFPSTEYPEFFASYRFGSC